MANVGLKNNVIHNSENFLVNGVPWPRLTQQHLDTVLLDHYNEDLKMYKVPLHKVYSHQAMDYLDSKQAQPLFRHQAEFIVKNNCKTILDVGSRHGPVLDHLYDMDYLDQDFVYYGFDTSDESIGIANKTWSNFSNIHHDFNDWEDYKDPGVLPANIDCVIFSGVLLYAPNGHKQMFEKFTNKLYTSKYAIIQEPYPNEQQTHWLDKLYLNTIQPQLDIYKQQYTVVEDATLDLEFFSGKRNILYLDLTNT